MNGISIKGLKDDFSEKLKLLKGLDAVVIRHGGDIADKISSKVISGEIKGINLLGKIFLLEKGKVIPEAISFNEIQAIYRKIEGESIYIYSEKKDKNGLIYENLFLDKFCFFGLREMYKQDEAKALEYERDILEKGIFYFR